MTTEKFVQNLKKILDERRISYTQAGRESGAGADFIRNIERRGSAPAFTRVQQMAQYLGMTTSELLGEKNVPSPAMDASEERLLALYRELNLEGREKLLDYADDLSESGKYKKASSFHMDSKKEA